MKLSAQEIREGLRDGTVTFCLQAAHENFTTSFLEEFSERILRQDWRDVATRSHLRMGALVEFEESEDDLVAAIRVEYGADISDLPGLPFWEVVRRCARKT